MRKVIFVLFSITLVQTVTAQSNLPYKSSEDFKGDTTAFILYNFMDRALVYQGKTFADVINYLNIPVKN